jgi:hypothetical protein
MDARWETIEGVEVLRVPGDDLAAIPMTGHRNSRAFQVFRVSSREPWCQIAKADIHGYLSKNSAAYGRFSEDLAASLGRGLR